MNELDKITDICHDLLLNFPGARDYLNYVQDRISEECIKKFKIGYFPEHNHINILIREVGEDVLDRLNLLYKYDIANEPISVTRGYFERNPLIIPYRNVCGNVIGLIGRSLLPDSLLKINKTSKYLNTAFRKGNYLFGLYEGLQSILDNDFVYLVEGQFDVIKAHEVGLKNIVAVGNAGLTAYQFSLLKRYTRNIRLLLDNDAAGSNGRDQIKRKFGKFANILDFYIQDPYKDIDECIKDTKKIPIFKIKK